MTMSIGKNVIDYTDTAAHFEAMASKAFSLICLACHRSAENDQVTSMVVRSKTCSERIALAESASSQYYFYTFGGIMALVFGQTECTSTPSMQISNVSKGFFRASKQCLNIK